MRVGAVSVLLSPLARDVAGEQARPGWGRTLGVACLPAVVGYLAGAALLALITVASAGAESSAAGAAQAGAVALLAAHLVPLTVGGAPLGVLPLLPTLMLATLVARAASGVAVRSGIRSPVDAAWLAGAIAGAHGVLGTGLALLATPVTVTAQPLQAAVWCSLVAGVAAAAGLARPCGLLPAALRRAPGWVQPGLVAGGAGLGVLLTAGLAAVLLGLVVSASEVLGCYQTWGEGVGAVLGLSVLSLGYLPNAAIAGLSWLAGSGVSVGTLSASSVAVHGGRVPAVPLLAALPQGPVQAWWACALMVPLVTGVAVGRRCATVGPDPVERLRALGVAAAVLTAGSAVLALLAGGRLGAGAFDPVRVPAGSLAIAVLAATLVGGCAGALLFHRVPPAPDQSSPAEPVEPDSEPDDGADGEPADEQDGELGEEAPQDVPDAEPAEGEQDAGPDRSAG